MFTGIANAYERINDSEKRKASELIHNFLGTIHFKYPLTIASQLIFDLGISSDLTFYQEWKDFCNSCNGKIRSEDLEGIAEFAPCVERFPEEKLSSLVDKILNERTLKDAENMFKRFVERGAPQSLYSDVVYFIAECGFNELVSNPDRIFLAMVERAGDFLAEYGENRLTVNYCNFVREVLLNGCSYQKPDLIDKIPVELFYSNPLQFMAPQFLILNIEHHPSFYKMKAYLDLRKRILSGA